MQTLYNLDGHIMTLLLQNTEAIWPYPTISEFKTGNMSIRSKKWQFIRYNDGSEVLYNCQNDLNEWHILNGQNPDSKVLEEHRKWIPETFAKPVPDKGILLQP